MKLPPKIKRLGLGVAWEDVHLVVEDQPITIEDLARAWASIDGKRDHFDAGKVKRVGDDETGHYAGYMVEAEEAVKRAFGYARARSASIVL